MEWGQRNNFYNSWPQLRCRTVGLNFVLKRSAEGLRTGAADDSPTCASNIAYYDNVHGDFQFDIRWNALVGSEFGNAVGLHPDF